DITRGRREEDRGSKSSWIAQYSRSTAACRGSSGRVMWRSLAFSSTNSAIICMRRSVHRNAVANRARRHGSVDSQERTSENAIGTYAPPHRRCSVSSLYSDRANARAFNADPRAERKPVSARLRETNLQPVIPTARLIQKQSHRPVVVRDHDVDSAVVVDVAERGAASDFGAGERGSCGRAHLLEPAGTGVMKELVFHPERRGLPALSFNHIDSAVRDE